MTPGQFDEWLAYWALEPWGDEWDQAAHICAATHNAGVMPWGGKAMQPSAFKPQSTLATANTARRPTLKKQMAQMAALYGENK